MWERKLHLFGYVNVFCSDFADCYRCLGVLHDHDQVHYRPDAVRDYVGRGTRSGYRALHTLINFSDVGPASDQIDQPVQVRLRKNGSIEGYNQPLSLKTYQAFVERAESKEAANEVPRVFDVAGTGYTFQLGDTVLHFIYRNALKDIAYIERVNIDLIEVDLFDPLYAGSRVALYRSATAQELPSGWARLFDEKQQKEIIDTLRRAYASRIKEDGRRAIRNFLMKDVKAFYFDERALDAYAREVAQQEQGKRKGIQIQGDWWLVELGTAYLHSINRLKDIPTRTTEAERTDFLKKVRNHVRNLETVSPADLVAPQAFKHLSLFLICPQCKPTWKHSMVGVAETHSDEQVFVRLHVQGADCVPAEKAEQVGWRGRRPEMQYLVLSVDNRKGITRDVIHVFTERNVDIASVTARRINLRYKVIRVGLDYQTKERLEEIQAHLKKVEGVRKVHLPEDPIHQIEYVLPPRYQEEAYHYEVSSPFMCGPPVEDSSKRYGRTGEMRRLHELYEDAMDTTRRGLKVRLGGSQRVGKTTLLYQFQEDLLRLQPDCLAVYHEPLPFQCWAEVQRVLVAKVKQELQQKRERRALPNLADDLLVLFDQVQAVGLKPVIILDEAPGLLYGCLAKDRQAPPASQDGAVAPDATEVRQFEHFVSAFLQTPKRLLILAGPSGEENVLPRDQLRIFEKAEPLIVTPLAKDDTRDLLRARKLGERFLIELEDGLADRVHYLTSGYPYWINLFGKGLWDLFHKDQRLQAEDRQERVLGALFRIQDIEDVAADLIYRKEGFKNIVQLQVRVPDNLQFKDAEKALAYKLFQERCNDWVLKILSDDILGTGLTVEELWARMSHLLNGHPMANGIDRSQVFEQTLRLMESIGGIRWTKEGRYKIACPLLAEFVQEGMPVLDIHDHEIPVA